MKTKIGIKYQLVSGNSDSEQNSSLDNFSEHEMYRKLLLINCSSPSTPTFLQVFRDKPLYFLSCEKRN